jgi:hypothetical protein
MNVRLNRICQVNTEHRGTMDSKKPITVIKEFYNPKVDECISGYDNLEQVEAQVLVGLNSYYCKDLPTGTEPQIEPGIAFHRLATPFVASASLHSFFFFRRPSCFC